ncbi:hypothetical protein J6590_073498 [Homalodisca vitripennis]|nr:hypothetical protein J6590_073498 [Homalodisca vitripennis]
MKDRWKLFLNQWFTVPQKNYKNENPRDVSRTFWTARNVGNAPKPIEITEITGVSSTYSGGDDVYDEMVHDPRGCNGLGAGLCHYTKKVIRPPAILSDWVSAWP